MTIQKTKYEYQDASLSVMFSAENDENEWTNDADLRNAINAIIKCASNWKTFDLTIKTNQYHLYE